MGPLLRHLTKYEFVRSEIETYSLVLLHHLLILAQGSLVMKPHSLEAPQLEITILTLILPPEWIKPYLK